MKTRPELVGRWLWRSLASRLVLLSVVFSMVPVLIYDQFRAADQETQTLLLQSAQEQGALIARALQPLLESANTGMLPKLGAELARFADDHTRVRLLLQPASLAGLTTAGGQGFFYVAAAPAVASADLDQERQRLIEQGILERLAGTCSGNEPLALRLTTRSGATEVLTSITPVNTGFGCWAIVTSHSAEVYLGSSIGQPYYKTPVVQAAMLIYLAMALLVFAIFVGVWRNLWRFGRLARDISSGDADGGSFAAQNTMPELHRVAEDFDRLVETLHHSAESLRRAAEDNAHAFKTPIAVIRQSVEPLKRIVPPEDARGQRALTMIERSVERLDGLVSFARRMDEATADVLEPPRRRIDLSALVERMVGGYAPLLAERRIHIRPQIARSIVVRASEDLLETVVENVIENAVSFSPPDGTVIVRLSRAGDSADLVVEDDGPGVDPANLGRIFERYFSHRPGCAGGDDDEDDATGAGEETHFGIGLWIVRRNVEAVGGSVRADNRDPHGLRMRIRLPLAS